MKKRVQKFLHHRFDSGETMCLDEVSYNAGIKLANEGLAKRSTRSIKVGLGSKHESNTS